MNYTREDFFSGRIGVRCDTREEYDQLMRECEAKGLRWMSGDSPMRKTDCRYSAGVQIAVDPETGLQFIYFRNAGDALDKNVNAIPFSTLFLDPWAEFVAGRSYLRVTKDEWPEFAKMCEAAGIGWGDERKATERRSSFVDRGAALMSREPSRGNRLDAWLDNGRNDRPIHPFAAIARPEPYDGRGKHKVGDLFEVVGKSTFELGDIVRLQRDDGTHNPWFERVSDGSVQAKSWRHLKPLAPASPRIEITTDGRVTTARLIEGKQTVKTATATCSPTDTFDFNRGAALACSRLTLTPEWAAWYEEKAKTLDELTAWLKGAVK